MTMKFLDEDISKNMPALNDKPFDDLIPEISDEAFVLGYPLGKSDRGHLPIWKRASIATEPGNDYEGYPIILVDTATSKGMSGGPVICRQTGLIRLRAHAATETGALAPDDLVGRGEMFLGVYSGRFRDELTELQLARVWKAYLVDEICRGNYRPRYDEAVHAPEEVIAAAAG